VSGEAWTAVGGVIAAILTLAGTIFVGLRSKDAGDRGAQLQADAGIASGYNLLVNDLRADVDRLRDDVDSIRTDLDKAVKRYRGALAYIRLLLAFVAERLPGHEAPQPPDDLMLDLD
jgi:hypothetical protein